ncbi:hypothetical protein KAR91_82865 [Candidatus Pacearchaeota archaeon]|nr:hypothetical protein [Candidatus Pacearchaeota archaeon]
MPLIDALVTNFDNGINNRTAGTIFGSMKQLDPTKFHNYLEDFDYFNLTSGEDWIITVDGSGTAILIDGDGGLLQLANGGAGDDEHIFLNKVGESSLFELGKPLYFKARFSTNQPVESDILMGLQITSVLPITATDGVFFLKSDDSDVVDLIIRKDSVDITISAVTTLVADTFVELSFFWDGIDMIWAGVNNTAVARVAVGSSLPDDEDLTISFGIQNGDALTGVMVVDYIFVAKER